MKRMMALVLLVASGQAAWAQSSASYRLNEQALNAGGRPAEGVASISPSYRLGLDSIGEAIAGRVMSSASYRMVEGFPARYLPPLEVDGLDILDDRQTLIWSWESTSTAYNAYRGALSTLPGGYGGCAFARVTGTSWVDSFVPAPGSGVFYLVTGENRLWEEGTKGFASNGMERANPSPCP